MTQKLSAHNLEDRYQILDRAKIERHNFVIISGCSGGGKSSLLTELARRSYQYIPEPGRQIVKEQSAIEGDALPWINSDKFLELALSRYIYQFNYVEEKEKFVFFDRSIIDAVQISSKQGAHFRKAAEKFRYHKTVFILPPWQDIYRNDKERKHSFAEAQKEYQELLIKYKQFSYEIVIVPQDSLSKRADFILAYLTQS